MTIDSSSIGFKVRELINDDHSQNLSKLECIFPDNIVNQICKLLIFLEIGLISYCGVSIEHARSLLEIYII